MDVRHMINFNFFEKKIINPSSHLLIRVNFMSNFLLLKICKRLWVTFDWSAAFCFDFRLLPIGC